MKWIRGWVLGVLIGVMVVAGAVAHYQFLASRIAERVDSGRAVTATVVDFQPIRGAPDLAVVRYARSAKTYEISLAGLDPGATYAVGDRITLYVDPSNPTAAATADGYASEPWWVMLPPYPVGCAGAVIAIVAAAQPLRRWWESRAVERDLEGTGPLSISMTLGEDADESWERAFDLLVDHLRRHRGQDGSPTRLRVTYLVPSKGVLPDFTGIAVGPYRRGALLVRVNAATEPSSTGEAYADLYKMLRAAVDEAERHMTERGKAGALATIRQMVERIPREVAETDIAEYRRVRPGRIDKPRFDVVRRGYIGWDVDTFVRWFNRTVASDDPREWERARIALQLTSFRRGIKGYDPRQVDEYLKRLWSRLPQQAGPDVDSDRRP